MGNRQQLRSSSKTRRQPCHPPPQAEKSERERSAKLKTPSKPKWMLPLLLAIVCAAAPSANFSARQTSTSPQRTLQASPTKHEIDCLGFSDDGRTFFAGTLDSYATIWRTDDWRAIATIKPQPLSTKSGQKFRMIK